MKAAAAVLAVASKHGGMVSREVLLEAGVKAHHIDRAVASGLLKGPRRGLYTVAPTALGWEDKLRAAVMATQPHGAVAAQSAAALMNFDGFKRDAVEIILPEHHQFRASWVQVIRSRDFDPATDVWQVNGLSVTRVLRTLLDLAGRCPEEKLVFAVESLRRNRQDQLLKASEYLGKRSRGRPGVRRLIELINERVHRPATHDQFEVLAEMLLNKRGLYPLRQQKVFASDGRFLGQPDLLFKDAKLVVEVDGDATHLKVKQHRKDRIRDVDFQAEQYFVLRTWPRELMDTPDAFIERLERALASRPTPVTTCAPFGHPEQLVLLPGDELRELHPQ